MSFSLFRRHFIAAAFLCGLAGVSAAADRTILVLGDSLSAEYGLKRGSGWVALLQKRLADEKIPVKVINGSISGDTTSGGRSRLPALLTSIRPTHVVIELGANDALRGLPMSMTETNLDEMTRLSLESGARVLLIGLQVPPNYGADYSAKFAAAFEHVSKARKVPLVPFLLKGIADSPQAAQMFQADRIHPREEAHPIMLDNVWPELRKLLK